jgi:hypothetical protein
MCSTHGMFGAREMKRNAMAEELKVCFEYQWEFPKDL